MEFSVFFDLHQVGNKGIYLDAITDLTADLYYQIGTGDDCADEARYYLVRDSYCRIIVGSCSEELGSNSAAPVIEITR